MKGPIKRLLAALAAAVLAIPPGAQSADPPHVAQGTSGMVVAAEPYAAEAGLEILYQGGNAVDAAAAVAFALAVTFPQAGNIGGGGFMLVRLANGAVKMVDYREMAPGAAHRDMYLDTQGNLDAEASTIGWRAAGVPGTVAGMELALRNYGTMTLAQVLQPAIRLAEDGFVVSEDLARSLRSSAELLSRFRESREIFLDGGRFYEPGDVLKQKDLARTLKRIAERGDFEFYQGAIARRLAREMRQHGGLITEEDMANYRARLRDPLVGQFRDFTIYGARPPSSGGIALVEMLRILEPLLPSDGDPAAPETIHLVAESMRRAFADRARFLGDADFACVPVRALTNEQYAREFRASIDPKQASVSADLPLPNPVDFAAPPCELTPSVALPESDETTHFSVVDGQGNAVANTTTINGGFGSGVTVPDLGFLLNNEMDDFAGKPGAPNALFGLVQSEANKIEPGKRPLSSMTPTIVTRGGQTILVLGSPGGPRIINAVFQVLLNRLAFGFSLRDAVAQPRCHHQWMPDVLYLEKDGFPPETIEALRALGHNVSERGGVGTVNAIERDPLSGMLTGVGDGRRGGVARGY